MKSSIRDGSMTCRINGEMTRASTLKSGTQISAPAEKMYYPAMKVKTTRNLDETVVQSDESGYSVREYSLMQ